MKQTSSVHLKRRRILSQYEEGLLEDYRDTLPEHLKASEVPKEESDDFEVTWQNKIKATLSTLLGYIHGDIKKRPRQF